MSKKCIWCGSEVNPNVIQGMYYCPRCDEDLTDKDVLPLTVFDHLTQSEEKLAEEFIYTRREQNGDKCYLSTIRTGKWSTEDEAYEATLEELKKEVEDEQ